MAPAQGAITNPSQRGDHTMNGYIAMFHGKKAEIWADTLLEAKEKSAAHFNAKGRRYYDVFVELAVKGGEPVAHDPSILGG